MGRIKGFKWSGWVYPAQQVSKSKSAHCIMFNFDGMGYKEYDIVDGKAVRCTCRKYKSIKEYKKINGK
jgi:hypothetical protein